MNCNYRCLVLLGLLFPFLSFSQIIIGDDSKTTRALVIGVSDYLDPEQVDLEYADRDALFFKKFLQSKSGGEVPEENIKFLINENATLGAVDDALNWLRKETEKGDRVVIYFSGHGGVEKQTLWQLGYLLVHETRKHNYRNNAIRVEDLNDLVLTLSTSVEAEVIIITDACRSGKLAGTGVRGASLTNEQLMKRKSNELRITSCGADQLSYEGKQWGGGRGVFSYHLINGLYGLADEDDLQVSMEELDFYLRQKFREEWKKKSIENRQTPELDGSEAFVLTSIDKEELAVVEKSIKDEKNEMTVALGRDADKEEKEETEKLTIEIAESSAFKDFVESYIKKNGWSSYNKGKVDLLFDELNESKDTDFYNSFLNLMSEVYNMGDNKTENFAEKMKAMNERGLIPSSFKTKFALTFFDEVQRAIGNYLAAKGEEFEKRYLGNGLTAYASYPILLDLAAELLPKDHSLQQNIRLKHHYFEGVILRLQAILYDNREPSYQAALAEQLKALQLDDKAAYIHNELGILYMALKDLEKAKKHFNIAADLAPDWVLPTANLANLAIAKKNWEEAKKLAQKAINLEPDYAASYVYLSQYEVKKGNNLLAEEYLLKATSLDSYNFVPFERLADLYLTTGRLELAESNYLEAEARKQGYETFDIDNQMFGDIERGPHTGEPNYEAMLKQYLKALEKDPENAVIHFDIGKTYNKLGNKEKAEYHLKRAIVDQAIFPEVCKELGRLFYEQNRFLESEIYLKKVVEINPNDSDLHFYLGELYEKWERFDLAEQSYRHIIQNREPTGDEASGATDNDEKLQEAYERIWKMEESLGRYMDAELTINEYFSKGFSEGISFLRAFYERRTEQNPEEGYWHLKLGTLFHDNQEAYSVEEWNRLWRANNNYAFHESKKGYQIKNNLKGIDHFKQFLALDDQHPGRADIYFKIGKMYLMIGSLSAATMAFEKALEQSPNRTDLIINLIETESQLNRFSNALKSLEKLNNLNRLDFEKQLQLGTYLSLSGRVQEAESILLAMDTISIDTSEVIALELANHYALSNQKEPAIIWYEETKKRSKENATPILDYKIARNYAQLKNENKTKENLHLACSNNFNLKHVLKNDPFFDNYRAKQWFKEIVTEFGMEVN